MGYAWDIVALPNIKSEMITINPKIMKGDIFSRNITGHELIICHQVNCKGVMGAGLAKHIRGEFPNLYEDYKRKCASVKNSAELLGEVLIYYAYNEQNYDDFLIANIFGQDGYGRDKCYSDYDAVRKALQYIRRIATPLPVRTLTTVRFPYGMGCGLAGGNWQTVYNIIKEELADYDIPVEIWRI